MTETRSLTEIANACGTDKGTTIGNAHCYTATYERYFSRLRNEPINLLEIGLSIGGPEHDKPVSRTVYDVPSVRMWQAYFPKAHIIGADISDCSALERERFSFVQVDCGSEESLAKLAENCPPLDIIVDDASHASYHQQLTLKVMFPKLKSGGIYVVEDLDWQPSTYERELPPVPKTAELLADPRHSFWNGMEKPESIELFGRDRLRWNSGIIKFPVLTWRFGIGSKRGKRTKLAIMKKA